MNEMQRWLRNYERLRHSKQPKELKESWQSSKYDFSDPNVRLEYVPEMGCSVGGCISALKKLWKSYKIAGRNGEPRGDIAWFVLYYCEICQPEHANDERVASIYLDAVEHHIKFKEPERHKAEILTRLKLCALTRDLEL